MEKLIRNSIRIKGATITVCRQNGREEIIDLSEVKEEFDHCYAQKNLTLCYVLEGEIYVTPFTREVTSTLENAGFEQAIFTVPLADGSYPKDKAERWFHLRDLANKACNRSLKNDCEEWREIWCKDHFIGGISEKIMRNCLKIPSDGAELISFTKKVYYPLGGNGGYSDVSNLGNFCIQKGIIVFVTGQGTFVAPASPQLIDALRSAGFTYADMPVPFEGNEEFVDPVLADKWKKIQSSKV